jgi:hypothetical protein
MNYWQKDHPSKQSSDTWSKFNDEYDAAATPDQFTQEPPNSARKAIVADHRMLCRRHRSSPHGTGHEQLSNWEDHAGDREDHHRLSQGSEIVDDIGHLKDSSRGSTNEQGTEEVQAGR